MVPSPPEMVAQLGTVTLDADTFDMVKLVAAGRTDQAQQKLKTLLALQNEPIMITGALIGNYIDMYRVLQAKRSRRSLADVAKDFGYGGKWSYRLGETERTASRFKRRQLEKCLEVLQKLDADLKSSKLDSRPADAESVCANWHWQGGPDAETGTSRSWWWRENTTPRG